MKLKWKQLEIHYQVFVEEGLDIANINVDKCLVIKKQLMDYGGVQLGTIVWEINV